MAMLNTGEEFPIGTFNVYSRSLTDGSEVFDVYMVGTYESDGDRHAPSARQQLIVEAVSEGRAYHAAMLFEQAYRIAIGDDPYELGVMMERRLREDPASLRSERRKG